MSPDEAGEEGLYLFEERYRNLNGEGLEEVEEFEEDTHFYQVASAEPRV